MLKETKQHLAIWLRSNKKNEHKTNLIDYMQEFICKCSNEDKTPAEQIKGMNRLLRAIVNLDAEVFETKE